MKFPSRTFLFASLVGSAFGKWPKFENGKCELDKYYCSQYLRDAEFTGSWEDRKNPRIIWKCKPGTDGSPTLEIDQECNKDQWCAVDDGRLKHYGGCWEIEDWNGLTFSGWWDSPDWKQEWEDEALGRED